jgi:hypothetical protein
MAKKPMTIRLQPFTDRNKKPRFRGVAGNGEIVFASEAYSTAQKRTQTMLRLIAASAFILDD